MRKQTKQSALLSILGITSLVLILGSSIFTNIFLYKQIEANNSKIRTLTNKMDEDMTTIKDSLQAINSNITSNKKEVENLIDDLENRIISTNNKVNKVSSTLVDIEALVNSLASKTTVNEVNDKVDNLKGNVDELLFNDLVNQLNRLNGNYVSRIMSDFGQIQSSASMSEEQIEELNKQVNSFKKDIESVITKMKTLDSQIYTDYEQVLNYLTNEITGIKNLPLFADKEDFEEVKVIYINLDSIKTLINNELERIKTS